MKTRVLLFTALTALAATPALAAPKAQQPASTAAGKALFDEGIKARDAQRWTDAIDKFKQANELLPSVGALLNVGDCWVKLGKSGSAYGAYHDAEVLARKLGDDERGAVAKKRQEDLEQILPRLTITAPKSEGLVVKRDGKPVDPATFDAAQPADSGSTTIEATAPGKKPFTSRVDLADGKTTKVAVEFETTAAPVEHEPKHEGKDEPGSSQRTIGIGLGIGGGAVFAVGLVFGGLTMGAWGSVKDTCPGGACRTQADKGAKQSDADRASTFGAISTVTSIIGLAAAAGGLALYFTAPKQGVAIAPAVGQSAYGLSVTLSR